MKHVIEHLLALGMSDLVIGVLELDVELRHGLIYGLERLYDVAEYDWLPLELLVLAKALSIDELHLLQDCGLPRLSGSC